MHSQGCRETLSHFQKHPGGWYTRKEGGFAAQLRHNLGFVYLQLLRPIAQRYKWVNCVRLHPINSNTSFHVPFMQMTHVGRNCGMLIMSSSKWARYLAFTASDHDFLGSGLDGVKPIPWLLVLHHLQNTPAQ